MRRSATRWPRLPDLGRRTVPALTALRAVACALRAVACALGAIACALGAMGCVSAESYELLVLERNEISAEREDLRERVRQLERSKARLGDANSSLSEERLELMNELETLRETQARLDRDVAKLERHKRELDRELSLRDGQLEERARRIQASSEELSILNSRLSARDQELAARSEELRRRDEALREREEEIRRLKSTYESFVADLESEIADGQIMIDQLREGVMVHLPGSSFFDADSVQLNRRGRETLAKVAAQLRGLTHRVEVQGHTDDLPPSKLLIGRFPSNWDVAAARAAAVARHLVAHGIDAARIRAVSYGDVRPIAPNDTAEDRARNRRIEIRLLPDQGGRFVSGALAMPGALPSVSSPPPDYRGPSDDPALNSQGQDGGSPSTPRRRFQFGSPRR